MPQTLPPPPPWALLGNISGSWKLSFFFKINYVIVAGGLARGRGSILVDLLSKVLPLHLKSRRAIATPTAPDMNR